MSTVTLRIDIPTGAALRSLKGLESAFGRAGDAARQSLGRVDALRKLQSDAAAAGTALEASRAKVRDLANQLNATAKPLQSLRDSYRAAVNETKALERAQARLAERSADAAQSLREAGIDTGRLVAEQQRLATALQRASASFAQEQGRVGARRRIDSARETLDVRPHREIQREIAQVHAAYARLRASGTASLAELAQASLRVRDRTAELRGQMNGLGSSIEKAVTPLRSAAALFAATGGSLALRGAIRQADAYANLSARLRLVTDGQEQFNTAQREVFRIAQQTRQPLEAVGSLYARLSPALKEIGGTQTDVTRFTETFGKALSISGASVAESASAILQLSQALGAGALRGEEFNAVNEASPRFMKALAESMKVPRGALKDLASEGKISSAELVKAIRFARADIDREFAQLPLTVEGSLTQLRNALTKALGERNEESGATASLARGIKALADNLGPVIDGIIRLGFIGAAVFGVQLVGAIANGAKALAIYVAQLKSAATFMGLVQRAGLLMIGAFVGYQIGAWARDNFQIVRDAGIYAVRGIEIARVSLVAGFEIAFARIVQAAESFKPSLVLAFSAAFDRVKDIAASFYEALASGLSKVGAGDLAGTYRDVAESIRASSGRVADLAAADIAAAAKKADAAVEASKARAKDAIKTIKAITDDQLAAPFPESAQGAGQGGEGTIVSPAVAKNGRDAADALKQLAEQAAGLRDQLYPAAAALAQLDANLDILRQTGSDSAELSRFVDVFAEDLVGGLDQATQAARRFSQEIAILESLRDRPLEQGGITAERFEELVERAKQKLRELPTEVEKAKSAFDEFFSQDFSRDFSAGFGEAGAAIGQIVTRIEQLTNSTAAYYKARNEGGLSSEELARLENEQLSRQVATYGDVANAAKGFFKQGSTGYRVLEAASRAFYAYELAQQAASVAATLINSKAKATAHGTAAAAAGAEAVATQATAGPVVGFALAAAMVAFLASIGVGIGGRRGGGGAPPSAVATTNLGTGTGTVLGDPSANSESIARSLETLEKYAETDLGFASQQLQALRGIQAALGGVSSQLFRANIATGGATPFNLATSERGTISAGLVNRLASPLVGGAVGGFIDNVSNAVTRAIFGSIKIEQIGTGLILQAGQQLGDVLANGLDAVYFQTIRETRRSFFGLSSSSSTREATSAIGDDLSRQLGLVLGGLADSALAAVGALGGDVQAARQRLNALSLGQVRIDLQGLSAEDAQERLESVFGAIGDTIATAILPAVTQFQRAGEGAFETLNRVAAETRIVQQRLDGLGFALQTLTGLDLARVGQQLISLAGGAETFVENTGTFFQEFFSEEEQTESLRQQLMEAVDALGFALPAARAGFRELITSLDLTSEQGQQAFTRLTALAGAADRYYDTLDEARERYDDAAKGLRNFRNSLRDITEAAAGTTLVASRQRFDSASRLARLGNLQALESLPDLGRAYLAATAAEAANRTEYLRELSRIQLAASQAEQVAGRLSLNDLAVQQLAEQRAQTALLESINGAIVPMAAGTGAGGVAGSSAEVAELRAQNAELLELMHKLVATTMKIHDRVRLLEDWNADGLPQERAA